MAPKCHRTPMTLWNMETSWNVGRQLQLPEGIGSMTDTTTEFKLRDRFCGAVAGGAYQQAGSLDSMGRNILRSRVQGMILPFCLSVFLQSPVAGQGNGRLSGTIEDAAGKVVSGAVVTLSLGESADVYASTVTSRAGRFLFAALRPASYALAVEAPAFAKQGLQNVKVGAGGETSLPPIRLAAGGAGQPAEGNNPGQALQAAGVEVAFRVDDAQRLPLPGRDPLYLLETLPGVQENGRAPLGVYGESVSLANITYEGVNLEATPARSAGLDSTTLLLRTSEVGDAAVATGAIDGCGCAQAVFSAPGGSAAFHGSVYGFTIPKGSAAQYWTDNSQNTPAATDISQLGATFGGPLRKDRLFFFLNYEADLNRSTVTRTGQVPVRPLSSQDPLMRQVLGLVPSDPSGTYRGTQDNGGTGSLAMARLDYLVSPRHSLGLTLAGNHSSTDDPSDSSVFGRVPTTSLGVSTFFFAAFWRWSPAPRLTNELRAGASLWEVDYDNRLRSQFGFIAILNDPSVAVSQPMAGMDPQGRKDRLHSYQDNLTWALGKHTLQAGLWFQQYLLETDGFNNGPLDSLTVPRYMVDNIAQGAVVEADQRFNIASPVSGYASGSTARSKLSTYMIAPYLHENWKPFRSLSISLGLRWGFLNPPDEKTGTAIIPVLSGDVSNAVYNKQMAFVFASPARPFYGKDTDGISTYTGLAWKPVEKLPLVLRGGWSASYINEDLLPNFSLYALRNPFQSFDVSTDFSQSPVALSKAPAAPAPVMPGLTLPALLSFANSYHQQPGPVYGVNPNLATPNVKYWNVGVESEVKGLLLGVRYVGNRLEEGPRSVDRNQVMMSPDFLAAFQNVQSSLATGNPTQGIPGLPGGGICANFSLQNCQPDLYARSLILSGQAAELGRWLEGQGYNRNGAYNFLGNPLAPQGIYVLSHLGVSRYDGLQLTLARRPARGLSLSASYVLSKVLSNLDDYRPGAIDPYLDLNVPSLEWAPSPFNVARAFKALATWDLPFSRSRGSAVSLSGRLLRDWSISAIVMSQSGAPFSLLSGGSVTTPAGSLTGISGLGTFTSQVDSGQNTVETSLAAGQIQEYFGIHKNGDGTVSYVNAPAGAFQEPAINAVGNLQRRMFTGPGAFNLNLGLRKTISLTERARAEFRAESINVLNNVNWLVGDQSYLGAGNPTSASLFNGSISQWNSPRAFQFSLRLSF